MTLPSAEYVDERICSTPCPSCRPPTVVRQIQFSSSRRHAKLVFDFATTRAGTFSGVCELYSPQMLLSFLNNLWCRISKAIVWLFRSVLFHLGSIRNHWLHFCCSQEEPYAHWLRKCSGLPWLVSREGCSDPYKRAEADLGRPPSGQSV